MAHQGLTARARPLLALLALAAAAATGCGPGSEPVRAPIAASPPAAPAAGFSADDARWPKFHSLRFRLSVPLPDGKEWKIDDHSQPELRAAHDATRSRVVIWTSNELELVNRASCEAKARARGLVPEDGLQTVEDAVTVGPEAYDTRLWVAIRPGKNASAPVEGHVFAFGAFIRRCLFAHFSTEVPTAADERLLSERLALAKVRVVGGIALDPPRATQDSEVPREKR